MTLEQPGLSSDPPNGSGWQRGATDEHMLYGDFRSRVCALLNMCPELVKFEFTVKFDPSSLLVLFDDASYVSMIEHNDVYYQVYVSSIE